MSKSATPAVTAEDIDARMKGLEGENAAIIEMVNRRDFGHAKAMIHQRGAGAKGQTGPFKSCDEFFKAVMACPHGHYDGHPQMKQWLNQAEHLSKSLPAGMNETVGADGGVMVPPEWSQRIMARVYDNGFLEMTSMLPIGSSNTMRVPVADETTLANGDLYGGVASYWEGEEDEASLTKARLRALDLRLNRLTAAVRATDELLADSGGAAEAFINLVVPRALRFRLGQALVRGNGTNKPEGFFYSPSKITVSKEAGQPANSILAENINKMWARLYPECEENAVWLVDRSVYPALDTMTIGNAGAQLAVYLPPGGLSGNRYGTIKGRPVISNLFCRQLGTEGDIMLVDPSTVLSIARTGLMAAVSMHVYFLAHSQVFRFSIRVDAKSWWRNALTPLSGGDTLSNIITLETRS